MVEVSPKATVPVLVLNEGGDEQEVIDESLDIMFWALAQSDPAGWLNVDVADANALIDANDDQFKPWLDRYKYPSRYEGLHRGEPRERCEVFLRELESRLQQQQYLCGKMPSIADFAIYSFVRQFAFVDADWFAATPYVGLRNWLEEFLNSRLFAAAMCKCPQWHQGDPVTLFGPPAAIEA